MSDPAVPTKTIYVHIDGRPVEVLRGTTILQAAKLAGVEIPTLCYLPGKSPLCSCFVCVVRLTDDKGNWRIVPACATPITNEVAIDTQSPEVHELRRKAIELLLGHHLGDCLGPCQLACPLRCDVPRLLQLVRSQRWQQAVALLRKDVGLPGVLALTCTAPCEKACRRAQWDEGLSVRAVYRRLLAWERQAGLALPSLEPSSGKRVLIVGGSLTGLAAAWHLRALGHEVRIAATSDRPAELVTHLVDEVVSSARGELERGHITAALERDLEAVIGLGVIVEWGRAVHAGESPESLLAQADAVLLAGGKELFPLAEMWGLRTTGELLAVDGQSFETSIGRIFAAGGVTRGPMSPLRAIADGKQVAQAIDRLLTACGKEAAEFVFRGGKLTQEELAHLARRASDTPALDRSAALSGGDRPVDELLKEATAEAGRCFGCACSAQEICQLRQLAARFGADPRRYASLRPQLMEIDRDGGIVYEPNKCVLCGRCVAVAEEAKEIAGITFVGRGFEVKVEAPFGQSFAECLGPLADACLRVCPTGALRRQEGQPQPTAGGTSSTTLG